MALHDGHTGALQLVHSDLHELHIFYAVEVVRFALVLDALVPVHLLQAVALSKLFVGVV